MKQQHSFIRILTGILTFCFVAVGTLSFAAAPALAESSEDYNTSQLSALISFFQTEITLEDGETTQQNYEYAGMNLDLEKPWEYPGITWDETAPHSVLAIDFTAYPKLSGKLDLSAMDKLQTVDISGTAIERATLGTNTALTTFYAKNSGLLTLNFSECTAIQTIDCSNSSLQALTLPDQKIESVHCENNYLTFASLPTGYKIADYSYAPQKDAFFIAQINVDVIQIDTKVNMTSYAADTITWYREDGSLLDGIEEVKSQVYTFSTVAVGDYVYAVMTSDAFPELTLTTDLLLIDTNDRVVWYYFLGCVVVFFILIFIARYLAAKRQGVELTTDKYTDSLHDKFEALIERISDKLRPLADRISKRKKK